MSRRPLLVDRSRSTAACRRRAALKARCNTIAGRRRHAALTARYNTAATTRYDRIGTRHIMRVAVRQHATGCHAARHRAVAEALVEAAEVVGVGQAIKDVSHLVVERVDVVLAAAARDCCCWYWVLRQV